MLYCLCLMELTGPLSPPMLAVLMRHCNGSIMVHRWSFHSCAAHTRGTQGQRQPHQLVETSPRQKVWAKMPQKPIASAAGQQLNQQCCHFWHTLHKQRHRVQLMSPSLCPGKEKSIIRTATELSDLLSVAIPWDE